MVRRDGGAFGIWWFWYAVLGILAVTALALVVLVSVDQRLEGQLAAADAAHYRPPATTQVNSRPTAFYFGDSYTFGTGASSGSNRFTALVSDHEGWLEANYGRAGTGYATVSTVAGCGPDGPPCPVYDGVIKETTTQDAPAVIVVSGGRNDYSVNAGSEQAAVTKFFNDLRSAYPKTPIYATSPIWDSSAVPYSISQIAGDVHSAADHVKATYLDIGEPLKGHADLVSSDGIHPNDAGHAAIAAAVEAALTNAGVKPAGAR